MIRDIHNCCFSRGRVLHVSLLRSCNQNCKHCMRSAILSSPEVLDIPSFRVALQSAILQSKPERIVISGGEPTLLQNLIEALQVIKELGFPSTLCTNATRISHDLARSLFEAGVHKATVGIEGVGQTYEYFRESPGSFSRVSQGIQHLISSGVLVTINLSLWNGVLNQIDEIAVFLNSYPIDGISITSPIYQGRSQENISEFSLVTKSTTLSFADALSRKIRAPVDLRVPACNTQHCPSGVTVFCLDPSMALNQCVDKGSMNVIDVCHEYPMSHRYTA